ncbi:matrin 3-like 1.2 isoform X1 [Nerophis lumbriciformis]|uniref:matrin 3-like 1.2 isoform X1 n=1 Tax=Nerophis lumbriciformis TaxID=546530 RepID=UPI002ADFA916|nr:matrin-3-like isoform X1 [Nerophis lumbriciformis]XP_061832836.1 matrin-3-like isoform X1 [Nerophis lumbriciformis]
MSQRSQMDGAQQGFAAGRGLLAAAETLNFGMNQMAGGNSGGGGGMEGQESSSRMSRGGGGQLGSTMKLFASLGLSPSDLDALAQIPEEDISVETLPKILMQLKNRKGDMGRGASAMSSNESYRGGGWDNEGRMGGTSLNQGSGLSDFGFTSRQEVSLSRGLGFNYGGPGLGDGGRGRYSSELSHQDSYGNMQGASMSQSAFLQRRSGSPSQGKVQDFLGVPPPMFPHVCSLCDFDVHSTMEWNQHTNGLRHTENRRLLLNMYPEWDPNVASGRSNLMESTNMSAGLLGPPPSGPGSAAGMMSSWGSGMGSGMGYGMSGNQSGHQSGPIVMRSRVVVVNYNRKPLSNKTLFAFTEPFGRLQEHLVLNHKAFLEMERHEDAQDMVNYYQRNPATLYGKTLNFYLSKSLMVIEKNKRTSDRTGDGQSWEGKVEGSKVVFVSNLPREKDERDELLTIAARFGTVEKHLFLTNQAFIQLGTSEDAEMMVKYYTVNPLTIRGRPVGVYMCTKYKTLKLSRRLESVAGNGSWGGASRNTSQSPSRSRDEDSRAQSSPEDEEDKEGEEVSGVVESEEEHTSEADAKEAEPEEIEDRVQEKAPDDKDDVTAETLADVGGATVQAEGGEESEKQKTEPEPGPGSPEEHEPEQDDNFLENMDEFVTLDELADDEEQLAGNEGPQSEGIDTSRRGGMRVVNVVGFRRGYNFLNELLGLAKPFGKLVRHLVLDRKPEAYLQFATEQEALAMVKFYNSNVSASVCGRPVRVNHSMTYPTIKMQVSPSSRTPTLLAVDRPDFPFSQRNASRVVYVGQLPNGKYSDKDIFQLAEPFGKVRKFFLNRFKRECFLEMERAEDACEMAEAYTSNQPKLNDRRLLVYVSRKYTHLKHGHPCPSKRDKSSSPSRSAKHPEEEPPVKKARKEEEEQMKPQEEAAVKEDVEPLKQQEEAVKDDEPMKPQEEAAVKDVEPMKQQEEEAVKDGKQEEEAVRDVEPMKEQEEEEVVKDDEQMKEQEVEVREDDEPMTPQEETSVTDKKEQLESQDDEALMEETEHMKPQEAAAVKDEEEQIKPPAEQEETRPLDVEEKEVDITQKVPDVPHQNQKLTEEKEVAIENSASQTAPPAEANPHAASLPLPPFDANRPIGVEQVKMGYYCRVCLLFYSNEETAKNTHCRSRTHYYKLQRHLEKEKSKQEKKQAKTSA